MVASLLKELGSSYSLYGLRDCTQRFVRASSICIHAIGLKVRGKGAMTTKGEIFAHVELDSCLKKVLVHSLIEWMYEHPINTVHNLLKGLFSSTSQGSTFINGTRSRLIVKSFKNVVNI